MKIKIISIVSLLILLVLAVALAGCSKPAASAAAGPKGVSDGSEDLIISWQMNVEEADAVNSFSPIAMTSRENRNLRRTPGHVSLRNKSPGTGRWRCSECLKSFLMKFRGSGHRLHRRRSSPGNQH